MWPALWCPEPSTREQPALLNYLQQEARCGTQTHCATRQLCSQAQLYESHSPPVPAVGAAGAEGQWHCQMTVTRHQNSPQSTCTPPSPGVRPNVPKAATLEGGVLGHWPPGHSLSLREPANSTGWEDRTENWLHRGKVHLPPRQAPGPATSPEQAASDPATPEKEQRPACSMPCPAHHVSRLRVHSSSDESMTRELCIKIINMNPTCHRCVCARGCVHRHKRAPWHV